jgi:transcriptional regulator with XRE-family HTH domain
MQGCRATLRAGQGSPRHLATVSGFLLKTIRHSAELTQTQLAEDLGVDVASVQGWESGRRPLTALRTADLMRLRLRLLQYDARPTVLTKLDDAIHADLIIDETTRASDQRRKHDRHPLGTMVHQHKLSDLITWPLTGIAPTPLRDLVRAQVRRGPVPDQPMITKDERTCFFDNLLVAAQTKPDDLTNHTRLARRQAIYLLGFDTRTHTAEWLHAEQRRALRHATNTDHIPSWIAVRSSAVALAHGGDRDPLRAFLQHALTNDRQEQANLNYWAYWVGEISSVQVDDTFMNRVNPQTWSGVRLLEHLLELLRPSSGHTELNIHTLWARPCGRHPRR